MFASIVDPVKCLGGIDLGGTKIEAKLFDRDLNQIAVRRNPTPRDSYDDLLSALQSEIAWLRDVSGQVDMPVGLGMPGFVKPQTGTSVTANLPATGRTLQADLRKFAGNHIRVDNDCNCFALSEMTGGGGAGFNRVFGLILGTGLGAGFCVNGVLETGHGGVLGEVGHIPLPAPLVQKFDLPILPCGCGRRGCYETFVSGRGIRELTNARTGTAYDAPDIVVKAQAGETDFKEILDIWAALTAELVHTITVTLDPDCIVLGGGLSNIKGVANMIEEKLPQSLISGMTAPALKLPLFGDSSGTRGAALLLRESVESEMPT